MGKHTTIWKCPKCGQKLTTHLDPQYLTAPECENYEAHHSKRSFTMVKQ